MSFGFGVGDFVTVLQLANKIRGRFVDAPEQFKAISDEVRSLSIILDDVKVILPQRDLTSERRKELVSIIVGCYNVLNALDETLGKYQDLSSDPKDCDPKSLRFKFRTGWKRLRWEPDDVKELRSRIVSNISLLNAFNGQLIRQVSLETKDRVDRLHQRQDDLERRTIIEWLTRIDYSTQQSDFIGRRQEGTGQWLLNSNEFQSWLNTTKQTLFCPGMPGAGKTMITSIVVDHLSAEFQNDASVGVAYLYCNFRRQDEQNPTELFSSLLKQLVQGQLSVPESVMSLYERHKDKARPPFDEILKIFHAVVADYSRTFIAIDALDECQVSGGVRHKLLSELFRLQAHTGASLFTTSRFIPEIEKEFKGSMSLEIRANDEDVQRYLDGHMSQLPSFVSRSSDLKEEIKSEIIKAVDGMFLLAQLHLDSLIGKKSPKAIRIALERLPKGLDALDSAYKEAMKRIQGQVPDSQELAMQVLSWIACAKTPLTTLELRHALAVEIGKPELDEENLPEVDDMVSVCAGLVTVDEESDIVRLVHYTTQEYFERTWVSWFPNAQTDITKTCVTYLSFDSFGIGFCRTDEEFEARLRGNILYDYAAHNWGYHACAASTEAEKLVLHFLKNEAKVSASSQAMMLSKDDSWRRRGYSQSVQRQITGVHLTAHFGLTEVMMALFENGYDLNVKDTHQQTPLWWAAGKGHEAVVKLLLTRDGVDPDSKDTNGQTPLSWAARNGHEAVVKLLLARDGVDPDSKDTNGWTPLSWAAGNGHEAVVKLLLARDGVDPDSKDTNGQTPLSWAAGNGHEAVVKLLLARDGVDPDSKDTNGRTPLSWAAGNGHEAVVELLLARDGVDPDSKSSSGQTPLSWAAESGHEAVVKLLLARDGVDPDSKSSSGRTPLSWAAWNGHKAVVKLLLARDGVDPDSKDTDGRTPLSLAARNGHKAVVKLLQSDDLSS